MASSISAAPQPKGHDETLQHILNHAEPRPTPASTGETGETGEHRREPNVRARGPITAGGNSFIGKFR